MLSTSCGDRVSPSPYRAPQGNAVGEEYHALTREGRTSSSATSGCASFRGTLRPAPSAATASTNTHASDVRSNDQAQRNAPGWRKSATTCRPASSKPPRKAGSAKSKGYKSAWPAPTTNSPRSTPASNGKLPLRNSACPPSSPRPPDGPRRRPTGTPSRVVDDARPKAAEVLDPEWRGRSASCYRREWMRTETKGTAALIWDGLVGAGRMRAS